MTRQLYSGARLISGARHFTPGLLVGFLLGLAGAWVGNHPEDLYRVTGWVFGGPATATLPESVRYPLVIIGGLAAACALVAIVALEGLALTMAARWAASPEREGITAALEARKARADARLARLNHRRGADRDGEQP